MERRTVVMSIQVSIHAPRTEGDFNSLFSRCKVFCFNPRPPHGGRRMKLKQRTRYITFQSTPPARRATAKLLGEVEQYRVSIHAPRTEGDFVTVRIRTRKNSFNPRPPHGGRLQKIMMSFLIILFQSTPPARRATCPYRAGIGKKTVSIHAPRTEGDQCSIICHRR